MFTPPSDTKGKIEYLKETKDFNEINIAWLIRTVEDQQNEIKKLRKEIDGTQVKFFVEDDAGYKYGSFSEYKHAEEHAQEEADERRIDLYIKKRIEGIVGCAIPD